MPRRTDGGSKSHLLVIWLTVQVSRHVGCISKRWATFGWVYCACEKVSLTVLWKTSLANYDSIQNSSAGAVATSTYIVFIAIEAVGFPISWLISKPSKVRRADGSPIMLAAKKPWRAEFQILWQAMTTRRMLLIIPVAFNSFFYGGIAYTYLARYFTVRTRALSGVLQPSAAIITTLIYGRYVLDNGSWTQRRRAQIGFLTWCLPMFACVAWLVANATEWASTDPVTVHDWASPSWARAYLPFLFLQCVGYWGQSVSGRFCADLKWELTAEPVRVLAIVLFRHRRYQQRTKRWYLSLLGGRRTSHLVRRQFQKRTGKQPSIRCLGGHCCSSPFHMVGDPHRTVV
jgi:hypothetical protein